MRTEIVPTAYLTSIQLSSQPTPKTRFAQRCGFPYDRRMSDRRMGTQHMTFGEWLQRRRRARDLTQQALAEQIACSVAAVRKFESNERRPSREIAGLLADALAIAPEDRELFLAAARGLRHADELPAPAAPPVTPPSTSPSTSVGIVARQKRPRALRLPMPSTPLFGRTAELQELTRLLVRPDCRLVTVVGLGGIGKTRVALAAAAAQDDAYLGEVYFVPLAAIQTPALLPQAIASAIGFTFGLIGEPTQQLLAYLRTQRMLLLLDNIEHLLAANVAAENTVEKQLLQIAERAPGVKLLVTSREPLNIPGEWTFDLHGLTVPPLSAQIADVKTYSAIAMFIDCAQRTQRAFTLTPNVYPVITRICNLLNGAPLGIELATAWGHVLNYGEIADEIERNIDFLSVNRRDVPERQRSLRATFEYSWRLLNVDEQRILARLAIFAGGFTREAAEHVTGADLPILSALVAKSLVRRNDSSTAGRTPGVSQASRYELHELVRQFAAAKLQIDTDDLQHTNRAHAHFYLALLQHFSAMLTSPQQKHALQQLMIEISNIRQAWEWAVAAGEVELLRQVAWTYWYFFELRNYFQEGEQTFRRAQIQVSEQQSKSRKPAYAVLWGHLVTHQAFFTFRRGHPDTALQLLDAALPVLRRHDDQAALGDALWAQGAIGWVVGAFDQAHAALREALTISQQTRLPWQLAVNHMFLGIVLHEQGDFTAAEQFLHEGLQLARRLGDPRPISFATNFLSRTAQMLGNYDQMLDLLHEGVRMATETEDRFGIAIAMEQLAQGNDALGRRAEAERYYDQTIRLYREIADAWSLGRLLNARGRSALERGEITSAHTNFEEALQSALESNALPNALDAAIGLAEVMAAQGQELTALTIAYAIQQHPASTRVAVSHAEELQMRLLAHLPPGDVETTQRHTANCIDLSAIVALLTTHGGAYSIKENL